MFSALKNIGDALSFVKDEHERIEYKTLQNRIQQELINHNKLRSAKTAGQNNLPAVATNESMKSPKAFISYARESDEIINWTNELATMLRYDGINVMIDKWGLVPGDQLTHFMERAIRENDYVLVICTPAYKQKSDQRVGGVGYEGDIITAEVYTNRNHRKYIPILRIGNMEESFPTWMGSKFYIDLSQQVFHESNYRELVSAIYEQRHTIPPIGSAPDYIQKG